MQLSLSNNMPKYMVEFIDFATQWLGIDRFRGELHIDLKQTLEEESFGLCWGDRGEVEMHIATRQWGAPVSKEDKLKTLAHELTHAHQYFTGHLVAGEDESFRSEWLGEAIDYDPQTEDQTPWEQQAQICEERIYQAWLNR